MSTGKRVGKYEVTAQLGKSPRSALYRGTDPDTGRAVALRVIPRACLDATALPAFVKASQALARLDHPRIAACTDVVENEKIVCLVSALCEGKAIAALLKEGAHPELRNVWDIARQLLEALAFAHVKGALHRDLGPGNLFLGPDGTLRVTDFGVCTLLTGEAATVYYRAPEQFSGAAIGSRTDIYQAGAIIYQLVTGKLPFTGTAAEVAHRVLQERPSDPSSYNNRIAWQLDWVIQKALNKDPIERFGAANDFAEGLRLGLQETVGRPLDPISTAPTPVAKPAPEKKVAVPVSTAATAFTLELVDAPELAPAPAAGPVAAPAPAATPAPALAAAPVVAAVPAPAPVPAKSVANLVQKAQSIAKPAPAAEAVPAAAAPARPSVLFVDDDERILNAVRALFRQDCEVHTASGGEAALEILARTNVHVVVSDQRMPGMTGVELLRRVRTTHPDAVRLLLTGYTDLAALVGSINEGEIFRFVMKPWDNDELRKAIAEASAIAIERVAAAAEAPAAPPAPTHPRVAGSLLVIDPKDGLGKGLERLLAGAARVVRVATPAEGAHVVNSEEVAAIVADLGAGMDGLVALFKVLKATRPEIPTILLADEPDSELGIELINKAQVYRFLPKPVSAKDLRTQVAAALRRYATTRPAPAKRPAPAATPAPSALPDRAPAAQVVVGGA